MRFLIIAFIVHLTLNIAVFLKGWDAFKGIKFTQIFLAILFGAELIIYSVGFLFYRHLPENIIHHIRLMGTSWMLFLFYVGGFLLIIDLLYLIFKKELRRPQRIIAQSTKIKRTAFISSVFMVIGLMVYGSYQFNHIVVNELDIKVEKQAGNIQNMRVAMVGDMHLGYLIDQNYARKYVDAIMAQKPDLILFVGDITDAQIEPLIEGKIDQELRRLSAPLGVYTCTGNHEYRFESEEKIAWLNKAGISVLRDSAVLVDSAFYVVGREDFVFPERLYLAEVLEKQQVDKSKPIIVLNHTPNDLDEEMNAGADIALYGHTHHGQVFPGNILTDFIFEVSHGYKKKNDTHIYVTSGLGIAGPQYRIGSISEIVVLNVEFGGK